MNGSTRVVEHVQKSSVYVALCYDLVRQLVVVVSRDGDLRLIKRDGTIALEVKESYYTSLKLATTKGYLVAGTVYGSIRVFDWPFVPVGNIPNG